MSTVSLADLSPDQIRELFEARDSRIDTLERELARAKLLVENEAGRSASLREELGLAKRAAVDEANRAQIAERATSEARADASRFRAALAEESQARADALLKLGRVNAIGRELAEL